MALATKIGAWDRRAVLAGHRVRRPLLTRSMLAVTWSGSAPAWIAALVICGGLALAGRGTAQTDGFLRAVVSALVAWAIGNVARPLIGRPRPFVAIDGHEALVWVPRGHSMPSTHAATSVGLFVALWLAGHPAAVPVGLWAGLTVVSRWYLGVHYPSDLCVGAVLGAVVALAMAHVW